jgi:hypothetical protein
MVMTKSAEKKNDDDEVDLMRKKDMRNIRVSLHVLCHVAYCVSSNDACCRIGSSYNLTAWSTYTSYQVCISWSQEQSIKMEEGHW